jgi:hypothetical protein
MAERPAGDEHEDHRRAGGGHGGDELLLAPWKPQLHPVAHLAAGAVERQPRAFADDDDGHVRAARGLGRHGDLGVAGLEDAAARGEADLGSAALAHGVEDRRAALERVGQAEVVGNREADRVVAHLEQRLDVGDVRVVAQQVARAVGVGADDGDRREVFAQRQRPVVLQQDDRGPGGAAGQGAVGLERRERGRDVDVRRLEQPELELDARTRATARSTRAGSTSPAASACASGAPYAAVEGSSTSIPASSARAAAAPRSPTIACDSTSSSIPA